MSISVQCSGCAKKLKAKDELAGKRVKCPGCGHVILVPAAQPSSQPKAIKPTPGNRPVASKGKLSDNCHALVDADTTANSQAEELVRLRKVRESLKTENEGKEKTEQRSIGCVLMIIGMGSFILPLLGLQFRVVGILGAEAAPIIGGLLAVIGLVLFALSYSSANSGTSVGAASTGQAESGSGLDSHPRKSSAAGVATTQPTAANLTATQTSPPSLSEECTDCLLNPIDACNICKLTFCNKHGGRRGSRKMCIKCYKKMRLFFGYIPTGFLCMLGLTLLFLSFCTKYPEGLYVIAALSFIGAGSIWLAIAFSNPARW